MKLNELAIIGVAATTVVGLHSREDGVCFVRTLPCPFG